jgi:hypothetical protein
MSVIATMHIESKCLHVLAKGRFSLVSAQRSFVEILETAVRERSALILLDGRQIIGEPSTIDRFYYAKFAALSVALARQRHGTFKPKFAYVLQVPVLDPNRFGVTVAANRGMNIRAFDSLDEARSWLGIACARASHTGGEA